MCAKSFQPRARRSFNKGIKKRAPRDRGQNEQRRLEPMPDGLPFGPGSAQNKVARLRIKMHLRMPEQLKERCLADVDRVRPLAERQQWRYGERTGKKTAVERQHEDECDYRQC